MLAWNTYKKLRCDIEVDGSVLNTIKEIRKEMILMLKDLIILFHQANTAQRNSFLLLT